MVTFAVKKKGIDQEEAGRYADVKPSKLMEWADQLEDFRDEFRALAKNAGNLYAIPSVDGGKSFARAKTILDSFVENANAALAAELTKRRRLTASK